MLEGYYKGRPKKEDLLLHELILLVWDSSEMVLWSTSQSQLSMTLPIGTCWFSFLFLAFIPRMGFIRMPETSVPLVNSLTSEV